MWPFNAGKNRRLREKEREQRFKVVDSQNVLLSAATDAADAAQHVTTTLRSYLEDSIRQFETTIALMNDALLVCDQHGLIKAFNPAAEQMFGYTSRDMDHGSVTSLFRLFGTVPHSHTSLWAALNCDQDGHGPEATLNGLRSNGETFPLEASMTRLDRSDGSTVMLMLIRELTEEYQLQHHADVHEHRYRTLFDLSFDGILIVQDGRVVAANAAAGHLFDVEPTALLAVPFDTLVHSQASDAIRSIDSGRTETMKAEATRRDGAKVKLLLSSASINWNDSQACLITVTDTVGLSLIEDALKVRTDTDVDMIVVFDAAFSITFANRAYAAYYGVDAKDIVGKDIRTILSEAERDALLLKLFSLSPESPTRRAQVYAAKPDGTKRLKDWLDHATYNPDGSVVEYQRTGRDITNIINEIRARPSS